MLDYKKNFKDILKDLRKEKELTQKELSQYTGITLSMITKYEQGVNTPNYDNLTKLSDFFNVPINTFLNDKSMNVQSLIEALKPKQKNKVKFYKLFLEYFRPFDFGTDFEILEIEQTKNEKINITIKIEKRLLSQNGKNDTFVEEIKKFCIPIFEFEQFLRYNIEFLLSKYELEKEL